MVGWAGGEGGQKTGNKPQVQLRRFAALKYILMLHEKLTRSNYPADGLIVDLWARHTGPSGLGIDTSSAGFFLSPNDGKPKPG